MVRIAIVEDEQIYMEQLKEYLLRFESERKENFEITWFSDGEEIVENYRAQFDIILMDIQMRFMDGMTAAEKIRKTDAEVVIIFITNMRQYAIRGYAVEALDYIVKPITYFAFSERLNRAIGRMNRRTQQMITIQIRGGIVRLDLKDLYYIESQGHQLIYHTAGGDYEVSDTMKAAEERLGSFHFCRGNKGYLINLGHVDSIRDGCAVVHGDQLLLSRARKARFMEELTNYWSEVR
ncbi:MAG: LytTR family DNA-binding domain-containing protein [Eubacteriales bacterium]|nr:LytTR family DNA-binding domain-containing protein [Eubacteriales bacterium]